MPNPSIKDEEVYQRIRETGASKEKAARIANAAARSGRSALGKKGGKAKDLEDRTVPELKQRAREIGIQGYSRLRKSELIERIRNH